MSIILFGQYPRSEELVKATREFDRNRISEKALSPIFEKDRQNLKALQGKSPFLSTGLFHWDDLMRPFAELASSCYKGALTRFFETNTFWRRLEFDGPFSLKEGSVEEWLRKYYFPDSVFSAKDPLIFTFPFLFLFRGFSKGIDLSSIQLFLEKIIEEIGKSFKGLIVFFEPNFGFISLSEEEKRASRRFLENIRSKTSLSLAIIQCFYPVEKEKPFLFSLPVDFLGIDFYCNRVQAIAKDFPQDKGLLAGIISTESTLPEPKEQVEKFLSEVYETVAPEKISLTTSGPAELLSRQVLDAKMRHLKEILK